MDLHTTKVGYSLLWDMHLLWGMCGGRDLGVGKFDGVHTSARTRTSQPRIAHCVATSMDLRNTKVGYSLLWDMHLLRGMRVVAGQVQT